ERLDYRDSAMNHAMLICGVALDAEDRPLRWKIENSWGEEAGRKGYFCASDKWFQAFTYQVIVHKKYLRKEYLEELEKPPVELDPWDPMGTLA
ncbi:MAG: aminopeptidase, partial [Lachnospiraceae bacterium]|nr:aminopeptidase [Lachnospiraceae bacterium]